jgi:hypothetical protein
MPCMCWYTPDKGSQKKFKELCEELVLHIKSLERNGDPDCCTIDDAVKLIRHLYRPDTCSEKGL